jgi:hypothetical protein
MTMTGDTQPDRDLPIAELQTQITELHSDLVKFRKSKDARTPQEREQTLTDDDIVTMAMNADNGDKFRTMFFAEPGAQHPTGDGSDSSADQALINMLWFYSQNVAQVERIWKSTPLGQRAKVQKRKNYVYGTIRKAGDRDIQMVSMSQIIRPPITQSNGWLAKSPVTLEAEIEDIAPPEIPIELPPGLFGEIAQFIYARAPYPHEKVAIAGAMGFMSGLCGRTYNITRTGLNLYTLVLGPSGGGKEAMHNGIAATWSAVTLIPALREFFSVSQISSGQALQRKLREQKCLLATEDEFSKFLSRITSKYVGPNDWALQRAILTAYGKSGRGEVMGAAIFSDKVRDQTMLQSPSLSILGESVPERVYELLTPGLIQDGTLARFILLSFDDPATQINKARFNAALNPETLGSLTTLATMCLEANRIDAITDVQLTSEAQHWLDNYTARMRDKHLLLNARGVGELWSRVVVNVAKLAALIAVGVNFYTPTVEVSYLEWAANIVETGVYTIQNRFLSGAVGGGTDAAAYADLIRFLKRYLAGKGPRKNFEPALFEQKCIMRPYMQTALLGLAAFDKLKPDATAGFERVIRNAMDNGLLEQLPIRGKKCFRITQEIETA